MQLPTVKLRHKATGKTRIVNQTKYALELGAWGDYEIISMRGGSASDRDVMIERSQEIIEMNRERNPNSPAFGDKQRAFEARAIVAPSIMDAPEPTKTAEEGEVTTAVVPVEEAPPIPPVMERKVPVIGGAQHVKMRGTRGRPKKTDDEGDVL
jgi:hypothetical protein